MRRAIDQPSAVRKQQLVANSARMISGIAKSYGVMAVDDDARIIEFVEKPAQRNLRPDDRMSGWAAWGSTSSARRFFFDALIRAQCSSLALE